MSAEDYLPFDFLEEFEECERPYRFRLPSIGRQVVTCKNCGGTGFHWGNPGTGYWRLLNPGGSVHECPGPSARSVFGKGRP